MRNDAGNTGCVDKKKRTSRLSTLPMAEPVSGFGRSAFDHEHFCPLQNLAIGHARALVLPQVLDPRFVDEAFEVEPWIGRFVKELPEVRTVAAAHFTHGAHRGHELRA